MKRVWVVCPVCEGQNGGQLCCAPCQHCGDAGGWYAYSLPVKEGFVAIKEQDWEAFDKALADAFSEVRAAALRGGLGLSGPDASAAYRKEVAPYIASALLDNGFYITGGEKSERKETA